VFHHQEVVINVCITLKYLKNIKSNRLITRIIFVYEKPNRYNMLVITKTQYMYFF